MAASIPAEVFRLPNGKALDTVWAEDGAIFLTQALKLGPRAFVEPYAGYVHLLPRTAALLVAGLPLSGTAVAFTVLSALVVGALAAFVFVASAAHVRSSWWRLALAASLPLLPIAGVEMLDSAANLQWYGMCALLWAFLWRPSTRRGRALQFGIGLAAAASDPLCALFLPLAAVRLAVLPRLQEQATTIGVLLGLGLQLAAHAGTGSTALHPTAAQLAEVYAIRVPLALFVGNAGSFVLLSKLGASVGVGATALLALAAGLWIWRRRGTSEPWLAVVFLGTSLLFFLVPVFLRWNPAGFLPSNNAGEQISFEARYVRRAALLPLQSCRVRFRRPAPSRKVGGAAPCRPGGPARCRGRVLGGRFPGPAEPAGGGSALGGAAVHRQTGLFELQRSDGDHDPHRARAALGGFDNLPAAEIESARGSPVRS